MRRTTLLLLLGGAGAAAVTTIALVARAASRRGAPDDERPLADRVAPGVLFRGNVRDRHLTGDTDEVCLRATHAVRGADGHVSKVFGRIEDDRFPGLSVEVEVAAADVLAVASEGASHCPRPITVRWTPITGEAITLRRDVRYRGCVSLPFYAPRALVRDKLMPGLAKKGFREIEIEEDPAGLKDCDFLVEGTWDRDDETIDRPGAVPLAWRAS